MKKLLLTSIIVLTTAFCLLAQPVNNLVGDVTFPTPEAASLGKYTDIPVNAFTGTPNIGVDIYTAQEGPLSVPISLSYHASGIKVPETASWVGLGWNLNAGGMITRTVQGLPDDSALRKGYYLNGTELSNDPNILKEVLEGNRDSEPDFFSFSFGGYSGRMYFDANRVPHFVPKQDLQVIVNPNDPNNPSFSRFRGFAIITPDGTRYLFGETRRSDGSNAIAWEETRSTGESDYKISSWHLLRIESADGNYFIDFNYSPESYAYKSPAYCRYVYADCSGGSFSSSSQGYSCSNDVAYPNERYYISTQVKTNKLASITTSTCTVNFVSTTVRQDLDENQDAVLGGNALAEQLDAIRIEAGSYCKEFNMNYSYFEDQRSTFVNRAEAKRLKLDAVQETSCETTPSIVIPPYTFEYLGTTNSDGTIFFPHTLDKAVDNWNYYNGQDANNNSNFATNEIQPQRVNIPPTTVLTPNGTITWGSANRSPNANTMTAGTLNRMNLPTGGYFSYEYEPHSYQGTSDQVNDLLTNPFTSCPSPTFENCCGTQTNTSTSVTFATQSELNEAKFDLILDRIYEGTCPIFNLPQLTLEVLDNMGTVVSTLQINLGDNEDQDGIYEQPLSNLITSTGSYQFRLTSVNGYGRFNLYATQAVVTDILVGGLRIKRTLAHDGIDAAKDIIRTYNYTQGVLYAQPKYGHYLNGTTTESQSPNLIEVQSAIFTPESLVPLSSYQGYHIAYGEVEEILGDDKSANGHLLHRFQNNNASYLGNRDLYPLPPVQANVQNGKLIVQETVAASGLVEARKDVIARTPVTSSTTTYMFRTSAPLTCPSPNPPGGMGGPNTAPVYFLTSYAIESPTNYQLSSTIDALDGVATTTTYEYDPLNQHLQPTAETMTNSDGTQYRTEYDYVFDKNGLAYSDMVEKNIIAEPITVSRLAIRNGNSTFLGDTEKFFSRFDQTTGLFNSSSTDSHPRLSSIEEFQVTWDAQGDAVNDVSLELTVNSYHPRGTSGAGYVKQATQKGWQQMEFNYQHGILTRFQYEDHIRTRDLHPGTLLTAKITEIDGQPVFYNYDPLMRLSSVRARPKVSIANPDPNTATDFNVNHTKAYAYPINPTDRAFVQERVDFAPDPTANSQFNFAESFNYVDGLGRLIQTVEREHSPNFLDVVTVQEYDNQNRLSRVYEPFESTANTGEYVPTIPSPANQAFTTTRYKASPLNRVRGITPPQWFETLMDYGANTANEVQNLELGGFYLAGELNKETATDPAGNQTIVFTDKRGKVILSRRDSTGNLAQTADTYTLYDIKERPSTIIPPAASPMTPDLLFSYLYDVEDQIILQKIPDKDTILMQYDDRELLTAMQDGVMRDSSRWLVNILDDYGRTIQTGFFQNAMSNPDENSPVINNGTLTKTFYDGGFGKDPAVEPIYYGKVRRTESAIMDGYRPTADLISTSFVYDDFGRTSTSFANNHLNLTNFGAESKNFSYDFADNLVFSVHNQTVNGNTTMVRERMTYDHKGRTKDAFHRVNMETEEHCSNTEYTVRDLVRKQKLGGLGNDEFLQVVDYSYNAQRWLTQINDVVLTPILGESSSTDPKDLFYLRLNYDNPDNDLNAPAQRNGNISNMRWQVIGEPINIYGFQYDFLDRLQQATYGTQNGGNKIVSEAYSTSYDYDLRGNILSLNRNGKYGATIQDIDQLSYDYYTNSNRIQSIRDNATCPTDLEIKENIEQSEDIRATNTIVFKVGFGFSGTVDGTLTAKIDCSTNRKFTKGFVQRNNIDYEYDKNGNQAFDPNKGIRLKYNHLNLPYQADWTDNTNKIEWLYTASGTKLQKLVTKSNSTLSKKDYLEELEYQSDTLEAIYHQDGRVVAKGSGLFDYEYSIRDMLGNSRVTFKNNGTGVAELLQSNHYYPYGSRIEELSQLNSSLNNQYQFNGFSDKSKKARLGMELVDDFGLSIHVATFRTYDPLSAVFWQIDPAATGLNSWSPYHAMFNNPILYSDAEGDCPKCQQYFRNAVAYSLGVANAVSSNMLGGAGRANPSDFAGPESQYAALGQQAGDIVAVGIGIAEQVVGALGTAVGVGATPISGGSSLGVSAAGIGTVVHGAATTATAWKNLTGDGQVVKAGEDPGSYTNYHESGKRYHGKGPKKRADQSAKEKADKYDDPLVDQDWTEAKNDREAFKDESRRMEKDGGHKNPDNYNKRRSPGDKYRKEDGET